MSALHGAPGVAPIVVFAIGNSSRGDDAIGPLLGERLQAALAASGAAAQARIEVIIDQQLVVEHVLDLVERQQAVFIDAAAQGSEPLSLSPITPASACSVMSHQLSPATLLGLYRSHLHRAPPPAALISVVGSSFELGAEISTQAHRGQDQAWAILQAWLANVLLAPSVQHLPAIKPAAAPPEPPPPAALE